ncbi:MAG: hypothetical protein CM1200mP22_07230 [Dehalococcoidia bacterium]|nr:MAG: hypothetical protein CM1200mP22_07230 [Dehalococcoidia bacterium]
MCCIHFALGRKMDRPAWFWAPTVYLLITNGILAVGLSLVGSPAAFFSLYVPGRMIFSGPLELGVPTTISNWFIPATPLGTCCR